MNKLELYAFFVTVAAVIFGVHLLAGFEPNKSIEYLAKWGPFGDLINPVITLVTTCFAYLAFKNTREQLEVQKDQVRKERFSRLMHEFGSDLGLIIDGYIFKREGHIHEGAPALKQYLDFLVIIKNNIEENPLEKLHSDDVNLLNSIYHEIIRVRHLIIFYLNKIPSENQEVFLERVRLSLPFTIFSCLSILAFVSSKVGDFELQDWIDSKNMRKYLAVRSTNKFEAFQ